MRLYLDNSWVNKLCHQCSSTFPQVALWIKTYWGHSDNLADDFAFLPRSLSHVVCHVKEVLSCLLTWWRTATSCFAVISVNDKCCTGCWKQISLWNNKLNHYFARRKRNSWPISWAIHEEKIRSPSPPGKKDRAKDGGREIERGREKGGEGEGDMSVCKKFEGRQTSWPLSDTQPSLILIAYQSRTNTHTQTRTRTFQCTHLITCQCNCFLCVTPLTEKCIW